MTRILPNPTHSTAQQHARRAEDLVSRAMSASMRGWFSAGRRREMLAAAQVHATLATIAADTSDLRDRLDAAETDARVATTKASMALGELDNVLVALRSYGQDLVINGGSPSESVARLMARVFNDEPVPYGPAGDDEDGGPKSNTEPADDMDEPFSFNSPPQKLN
ncbi:hypothetical protein [Polymorphospora lycopeni]|uniref:Uncharacterized protein n=1 Tax=Polymorphospora lycopeni TaxID=3140240 RepID=A0ABV5CL13_9ACTN